MKILSVLCIIAMIGCAHGKDQKYDDLETVEYVDINRYMGTWYEITRKPQRFQEKCLAVRANYTLKDNGKVRVLNECERKDKKGIKQAKGLAKIVDENSNAKLKVSFDPFKLFYGPYWILELQEDYNWVLVGAPDRESLWVLSRTPVLPESDLKLALAKAVDLGFDLSDLIATPTWKISK